MEKDYAIISIDVEEAFDETPCLLLREISVFTKVQWQFSRERTIFSKLFVHVPKLNFDPFLTPYTKMNSKRSRLLCPWDFPGKRTGVGGRCLLLRVVSVYFSRSVVSDSATP